MFSASATLGLGTSLVGEYATLVSDASLRQRAQEAENAARIESELARKVQSEFIANVSHEICASLNAMMGFARLIGECERHNLSCEQVAEYAALIQDTATHLLAVINDTIDISKAQSGRATRDAREGDLRGSGVVEAL